MRKSAKRSLTIATAVIISVAGGTAAFAYASGWFKGGGTVAATSSTIGDVTTTVVGAIKMGQYATPECAGSAITATLTFVGELVTTPEPGERGGYRSTPPHHRNAWG